MKERFINVIFSLDCFLFSLATLGGSYPFESFSSAAWRAEGMGKFYGRARKHIDAIWLFCFNQTDHCANAYFRAKLNLPEDQR